MEPWWCITNLEEKSKQNTAGGRYEDNDLQHLGSGLMAERCGYPA